MPFLLLLWPLIILIIGIALIGLLIGSVFLVFKLAVPLLIIWVIYRVIVGPRHHHRHDQSSDWYAHTQRPAARPTSSGRQRKEARDVKVDDDDWSDF